MSDPEHGGGRPHDTMAGLGHLAVQASHFFEDELREAFDVVDNFVGYDPNAPLQGQIGRLVVARAGWVVTAPFATVYAAIKTVGDLWASR